MGDKKVRGQAAVKAEVSRWSGAETLYVTSVNRLQNFKRTSCDGQSLLTPKPRTFRWLISMLMSEAAEVSALQEIRVNPCDSAATKWPRRINRGSCVTPGQTPESFILCVTFNLISIHYKDNTLTWTILFSGRSLSQIYKIYKPNNITIQDHHTCIVHSDFHLDRKSIKVKPGFMRKERKVSNLFDQTYLETPKSLYLHNDLLCCLWSNQAAINTAAVLCMHACIQGFKFRLVFNVM